MKQEEKEMKAYSFKYNKKTNRFGFTDSGRRWISFKSDEFKEVAEFITRKDISIRVEFMDNEYKEQKVKVKYSGTTFWSLNNGKMHQYYGVNKRQKFFNRMAIEFPLVNGRSLFVWYDRGVVFYGKTRLSAVPINKYEVKFSIAYQEKEA